MTAKISKSPICEKRAYNTNEPDVTKMLVKLQRQYCTAFHFSTRMNSHVLIHGYGPCHALPCEVASTPGYDKTMIDVLQLYTLHFMFMVKINISFMCPPSLLQQIIFTKLVLQYTVSKLYRQIHSNQHKWYYIVVFQDEYGYIIKE